MFCPSGGMYTIESGLVSCSVHGTLDNPLDSAKLIRESLENVLAVQEKYESLCCGTSVDAEGNTVVAICLQARNEDSH